MKSCLVQRAVTINNRTVRLRMEPLFWISLEEIAAAQATTALELMGSIDASHAGADLAAAIRAYVLDYFRTVVRDLNRADDASQSAAADPGAETPSPSWLH